MKALHGFNKSTVIQNTLWTRFYADISETIHDIFIQTHNWFFGMKLRYECGDFKIKHLEEPQPDYHPLYLMEND